MTNDWAKDAVFYHIYPLGCCGAPDHNHFSEPVVHRLGQLAGWLDHAKSLGANALYLGPVFQSSSHGYDTADYYQVDRRLGDHEDLTRLANAAHQKGIRLVLDGVFNHVGRDFWAFKDVLANGEKSNYKDWFYNLRFGEHSAKGDPFQYEGWHGHDSLVKLNLSRSDVRAHLFDAVGMWMDRFGIDGLRLDAADCIEFDFLRSLRTFTQKRKADFWLMGEVVHGDYREWANPETLDSVTNYESYKGLFSSLNDANYFEIAHSLQRQFGEDGIYKDLRLYNFVDNHDVDRVASKLKSASLLYPLYMLLFTMPGMPSIYYGSEWGMEGIKQGWSDSPLRPALDLENLPGNVPHPDLANSIRRLAEIRHRVEPLRYGNYRQIYVNHQQFVFSREYSQEVVVVALNSAHKEVKIDLHLPWQSGALVDLNDQYQSFQINDGSAQVKIPSSWGRILKLTTRGD